MRSRPGRMALGAILVFPMLVGSWFVSSPVSAYELCVPEANWAVFSSVDQLFTPDGVLTTAELLAYADSQPEGGSGDDLRSIVQQMVAQGITGIRYDGGPCLTSPPTPTPASPKEEAKQQKEEEKSQSRATKAQAKGGYLSQYPVTSGYGSRGGVFHHGVDIDAPYGTPLPALVGGTIVFAGYIPAAVPGYPNELIIIQQASGFFIVYGHLSSLTVTSGWVDAGTTIGHTGNSGYVIPAPTASNPHAGDHLHIERRNGTKSPSQGLSAYPSQDVSSLIKAYGK